MLDKDRDRRPPADKLEHDWFGEHASNELPTCDVCMGDAPRTKSGQLIDACKNNREVEVRDLIASGASPKAKGAIHQAAAADNLEIVRLLLERGVEVNTRDYADQNSTALCSRKEERADSRPAAGRFWGRHRGERRRGTYSTPLRSCQWV